MSKFVAEISEDYCPEEDEFMIPGFDSIPDSDTFDDDLVEIERLEKTLFQLDCGIESIRNHGFNQTSFVIMKTYQLLQGTALEAYTVEQITNSTSQDNESLVAIESLQESYKRKAAEWSAKIISTVTKVSKKIGEVITSLWGKISTSMKSLNNKTWDVTKNTAEVVKAHPYKTIMVILAAAAAVVGIVHYVSIGAPGVGATRQTMGAFVTKVRGMFGAIKLPGGGKVATTAVAEGMSLTTAVEGSVVVAAEAETLGALGWTTNAYKAIAAQTNKLWTSFSTMMQPAWDKSMKFVIDKVEPVVFLPKIKGELARLKTGSRAAGWAVEKLLAATYYPLIFKIYTSTLKVLRTITIAAFEAVNTTFRKVDKATD